MRKILIFYFLLLVFQPLAAQKVLTKKEKKNVVESVSKVLTENYVFPEIAEQLVGILKSEQRKGRYDTITSYSSFAKILTKNVQSKNGDKHLRVLYEPERIKKRSMATTPQDSIKKQQDYRKWLQQTNFGFKEAMILEGNIGYVNMTRFSEPELASSVADGVIQFVRNSDAIIFDLRNNGGGTPQMVQWIISYFFEGEPFLLNSFYKRESNSSKQFWTIPHPDNRRLPEVDLYVLTSGRTFSAAEEFAYDLKHLKRATIIGEITGGGAHPGGRINISKDFNVWVPTARAINPITDSNWEGVGVIPDIPTTKEDALRVAYRKALENLIKKKGESDFHNKALNSLKEN